jgi:hypothetical protein
MLRKEKPWVVHEPLRQKGSASSNQCEGWQGRNAQLRARTEAITFRESVWKCLLPREVKSPRAVTDDSPLADECLNVILPRQHSFRIPFDPDAVLFGCHSTILLETSLQLGHCLHKKLSTDPRKPELACAIPDTHVETCRIRTCDSWTSSVCAT